MAQPVKTLIALESGSDHRAVQDALDLPSEIQIVGLVDGLEESWNALQEAPADLLLIGCAGYSDRVLFLIDGAVKQKRERPVVVLCDGPSNGFVRRAFEAGADDFITLPESPQSVAFALQKAMARTTQLWPLAVATRLRVEATASRNQPSPQTDLPVLWVRVSSTSRLTQPVNFRRVRMRMPMRLARSAGFQAERSKKL